MASRIDYSISVSAIQEVTHEGQTVGIIDQEIGRTLGGGNSSKQWDGSAIDNWGTSTNGEHEHIEAWSTPQTVGASGDDMILIKHTGKRFDSSTDDNLKADGTIDETTVTVYAVVTHTLFNAGDGSSASGTSNIAIASLEAGECMIIPECKLGIKVGSVDSQNTAPAVEYAKLT